MTANTAGRAVRRAGRKAADNPVFLGLVRAGLATRGVIYLLIGWLAVQVGFGNGGGKEADNKGALRTVAESPGGMFLVWALAVGFAGLALLWFYEAVYGQPVPDGRKATKRLASLGRGLVYTVGFAGALTFALGSRGGSSDSQSKTFTARAMTEPGGRWLVLAVGIGFLAVGVANLVTAVRRKFQKELHTEKMGPRVRPVVKTLGVVGHIARGLVFGAVGAFLAHAAITFDPNKAKGLDGTLREFADTPAGPWLLIAVAAGLVVYGLYSLCEARWRKVEPVRS
ncbi:DUF1206 domain-containing protein [Actinomadura barringtoniae]|uniref:DUF1206 domain-containing protein n=1 Tax=Actinomadura barringtoniae TaxID=1427535 RepID=A0A939T6A1_9ACTN|nr:DUF1206 domain-containing protein [Actinomadura barringtoniae]MBO2450579.1 DUF1206 domain-containing protein [Actinomadura barringtoniae]